MPAHRKPCKHGSARTIDCHECLLASQAAARERARAAKIANGWVSQRNTHPSQQPRVCPHGRLGIKRCPDCHREAGRRRKARLRAKRVAAGWVPTRAGGPFKPTLCPHGVLGIEQCAECLRIRGRESARLWRAANPERARELNLLGAVRRRLQPGAPFDPTVTLAAVIERFDGLCQYSVPPHPVYVGRDRIAMGRPDAASIDHRIPLSKGGGHVWKNVTLACRAHNSEKHDDVCEGCDGPITELGESLCSKCRAKGRGPKERLAVCGQCGNVEMPGGWCSQCRAKGADIWAARDLTRKAAHTLSRSLFPPDDITEWVVGWAA